MIGETVFQLRVNQCVNTPNGPGVIQGRMREDGEMRILVAHNPKDPRVSESVRKQFLKGIWVLQKYPVDQITAMPTGK